METSEGLMVLLCNSSKGDLHLQKTVMEGEKGMGAGSGL